MGPNDSVLHPALRSILFGIELFISVTIGITIVFPVLFVVLSINELLRLLIRIGLWLFYGDYYELCTEPISSNYAVLPKEDNCRTILYASEVEGPLDIQEIRQHYQKHVVGNKIFRNLKYIWENKWLFMCLKKCENFDISNHVRIYPGSEDRIITEKELLQEVLPELRIDMPGQDKPQWEEVIIQKYKPVSGDVKAMRILRMHHSYMDGTSTLLHFVANTWSGEPETFPYVINPCKPLKISNAFMFIYKLTCVALFPLFLIKRLAQPPIFKTSRFSADTSRGKALFSWTKPMPINEFRHIKDKSGVSMSGVLAAVLAGAMRNFELKYPAENKKFSTERHPFWIVAGIFPFPSDRLCNDHVVIETYLDTSDISGCERLSEMNDELSRMSKNPAVTINFWFASLMGRGPSIIVNLLVSWIQCSTVLSNVPLCTRRIKFGGKECYGLNGWVPLMAKAGLCITTVRYGEHMRYCLQAHPSVVTEEQLAYLVNQIEDQVDELGLEVSTLQRKISTDITLFECEKKGGDSGVEDDFRNEDEFNKLNNNNDSNGKVTISNKYSLLFKLKDSIEQIRDGIKKIKEE